MVASGTDMLANSRSSMVEPYDSTGTRRCSTNPGEARPVRTVLSSSRRYSTALSINSSVSNSISSTGMNEAPLRTKAHSKYGGVAEQISVRISGRLAQVFRNDSVRDKIKAMSDKGRQWPGEIQQL